MATTTSSVTINVSSRLILNIQIDKTNSNAKSKFYGELRQLWVEINSHCERLHLLDSTTRVLSACIECKITPYGMVPLDIDGLENADEYVMQLVVSILFCMFHL
jgi:stringent starvation protein B